MNRIKISTRKTNQLALRLLVLAGLLASVFAGLTTNNARAASQGTVEIWGSDWYGETVVPAGLTDVTAVAAGFYHSLALKSDGTVVGWGEDSWGQSSVPAGLTNVIAVAAGGNHSLALKSDGTVAAWGDNSGGENNIPAGLTDVVAIAAGVHYNLAVKSDGTLVGWGYNLEGEAVSPIGLTDVTAVAAGYYHSVALKSDGTVVAWGSDDQGQTPAPAGLNNVVAVAAAQNYSLALKGDGTVVGWGFEWAGAHLPPAGLTGVVAIAAGYDHALALKSDGTVVGWGDNSEFQLNIPAGLTDVTAIAGGIHHSVAIVAPAGLDTTAPTITITTPVDGAAYLLNQNVLADFACQDEPGGSGLASCIGTVPNGSSINTASIGPKSFTVNAADNAGNTATASVSYKVIYKFTGFSAPVDNAPTFNIANAGQTIPLRFRVTDANDIPVTDLVNVTVTAESLQCELGTTVDQVEEYTSGNSGLLNLGDGYYQFNWKTPKSYANSCKTLWIDLGEGEGFEHPALFMFTR